MKCKLRLFVFIFCNLLWVDVFSQDGNTQWPKEVTLNTGEILTIYQPQPESFSGNNVTGRAAISVRKNSGAEPVFGAVFFNATIATDKDNRIATIDSIDISNAKFSGIEDQAWVNQITDQIETNISDWNIQFSLDDLVASLKEENPSGNDQFNNNPPKIIYRNRPTTLIIIDGDPKVQRDDDLDADRVMNTPALIFKEGNQWNLYNSGLWYKSSSITSGWVQNTNPSQKVQAIDSKIKEQQNQDNESKDASNTTAPQATDILVSTEPAELLQTTGEANYQSVQGTSLLYVSNTTNQIFKDINSQKTYVLLSGRWYAAPSISGPWEYIPSDQLPADFARIPEGSEKDDVLSSVAGTDAAQEAKIDAEIPQTAKVDRDSASVSVTYDGEPQFQPIEGTNLQLAENANITVMIDGSGRYFALDNGIWFVGNGPNGPWSVANERPKDVDRIPPSSSAYNTRYVYIYETTPQYVYVGYTPGYMGCYIYGPTIVYGTGFYYRPWYRRFYYPRPHTWGFGFSYNPWTGWSIGFGFNAGFGWGYGWGHHYGGWFGPPVYRPPYRPRYTGGYYGAARPTVRITNNVRVNNRINIYNNHRGVTTINKRPGQVYNRLPNTRPGNNNRFPDNGRPNNNNRLPNNNVGNNNRLPNNGSPNINQPRPSRENNNVYADRNGNIFQRDNRGNWNQRDNQSRSWQPAQRDNPSVPNMNRASQMRDRGTMRTNNFNQQSRPSAPPPQRNNAPNNNRRR